MWLWDAHNDISTNLLTETLYKKGSGYDFGQTSSWSQWNSSATARASVRIYPEILHNFDVKYKKALVRGSG